MVVTACIVSWLNWKRGRRYKRWHEILNYETNKRVVIKDPAIGILSLILNVCLLLYFSFYRIYVDLGYEKIEEVTAMVQTSLQSPSLLPRTTLLSYCTDGPRTAITILPCVTGPDAWVMAPSKGGKQLFIATRLKDVVSDGTQATRSFVTYPEAYTIGVTFTLQALGLFHQTRRPMYSQSITEITTNLADAAGNPFTDGVTRIGRFDVIKLSTLLFAAGITGLDEPHALDAKASNREDGLVIVVSINCPMDLDGSITTCVYQADHMRQTVGERFVVKNMNASSAEGISSQERRGITVMFKASGNMGMFDLPTLVLNGVASLAMVTIVSFILDWLLANLLPLREVYRLSMFEESVNIHQLRQGNKKALAGVKVLDADKHARRGEDPHPTPPVSPKLLASKSLAPATHLAPLAEAGEQQPSPHGDTMTPASDAEDFIFNPNDDIGLEPDLLVSALTYDQQAQQGEAPDDEQHHQQHDEHHQGGYREHAPMAIATSEAEDIQGEWL
mmetsp:Transcript_102883/g.276358  ORF Transcript_102883/g.276358 Transcript_102883/m.276358 type:complete len:503 (+) Transcript_102883:80-1588(+)